MNFSNIICQKLQISPITDVKSSGAELPAAINVAPATSSVKFRCYEKQKTNQYKMVKGQETT